MGTRAIPGSAADSGTVLSGTALTGNGAALADAKNAADSFGILSAATPASNANVARTVAQFQPTIPAYAAAADGLKITVDEQLNCVLDINRDMLYIAVHGSDVVAVMTSPVDAHLIAKPLSAQIWTCHPNSTDATLLVGDE